ncbi:MAG: radical SAM protein [Pseudohongiellaceae bacterium]
MNSKADVIAFSTERTPYPQDKSRWFGSVKAERLRLVFSFYSPDGNEIAMPVAAMSAYLKRDFPWVDISLEPVLILRDATKYSPENYAQTIKALNPDLIAFSVMSPHWFPMEPYFAELKKLMPNLPVLIGGYQAMLSQDETIQNPDVDYICVGDGEYAMGNIVQHLRGSKDGPADGMWEKMLDGSVYKTEPHQNGDLAALPFPDYDIFAREDGFRSVNSSIFGPKGKLVLPVMTGRGCPYRCTYCCNTPLLESWKSKKTFLRKYDPEAMVTELERLRDTYGVGYFEFWDELFLSNLKFVKLFFALYRERIHLPFSINSRVEVMNEEFCRSAADAGCHTIWFGIESGDEKYRGEMLGRRMKNPQIVEAAENCKKAGINRLTFNIVGMPLETAANMRETLALNQRIKPEHFFFFPYIPLRGTPLYDVAKREGLLLPNKKNLHYLSAANDRQFTLNMKEMPELLSQVEYNQICLEMYAFQEANNRLSYADDNQAAEPARVEDKSFSLTDDTDPVQKAVPDLVPPAQAGQVSLINGLRNLFRAP